ncbi:MAG: ABC transporter permease, partial [Pseudomonadota bacterium]
MILQNLYSSWRYLKHNPLFTLINVGGLVIGITSALFIFIYVSSETSYDQFHEDSQDIYRVLTTDDNAEASGNAVGITAAALGPEMEQNIPGVSRAVRFYDETRG